MNVKEYIENMKSIQVNVIQYLDQKENTEENYQNLIQMLNEQKILESKDKMKPFLYLLSNLVDNHHRKTDFYSKIEKILHYFQNKIKVFSNIEIYHFFENNKKILLFLVESKILIFNDKIQNLLPKQHKLYFDPEIRKKIDNSNTSYLIEFPENFYEKRKTGENDHLLYEIIRNDLIDDFISNLNDNNFSINSIISDSIFETNLFLLSNKETTIIEYAAFFGAIQIFSYLLSKGANLTERIWLYAIHSDSIELINFIQNNCSYVIPYSYIECIKEAIACHHNQLFDHFLKLENKNDQ